MELVLSCWLNKCVVLTVSPLFITSLSYFSLYPCKTWAEKHQDRRERHMSCIVIDLYADQFSHFILFIKYLFERRL